MVRLLLQLACVVCGTLSMPAPAQGQSAPAAASSSALSAFVTTNAALNASLERLARSRLWREAADTIQKAGRRAVIVTADEVVVAPAVGKQPTDAFDATVLAEVAPIPRDDGSIEVALVVINLALLEQQHREQTLPPFEFERDLDRILVHEIYGHAVPYLLAGHMSGRCADPQPRERAADACSIRRENAVRAELGLGRRVDYGLEGLSLSRRSRN